MKRVILAILLCITGICSAQDRMEYINRFRDIAIVEMHRTGIPASIKLAQGILESNAGASMLAVKANNHFGMKCGSQWKGRTMLRRDDDRNANGKLIKSCFRVFDNAEESFVAHSEFLRDPAKASRYGFLFALPSDDYRGWAHGLKKAGYATNPRYPQLLIRIIEQYDLQRIDSDALTMIADASTPGGGRKRKERADPGITGGRAYPKQYFNRIETVVAFGGETPVVIGEAVDVKPKRIVKYNESIGSIYETFAKGQRVFLQPKRNKFRGDQQYHIVKSGENMIDIADQYGIKTKKLYKRNKIIPGLQPAPGQRLTINKRNKREVKVVSHAHPEEVDPDTYIEEGFLDPLEPTRSAPSHSVETNVILVETTPVREKAYYVVQQSDTLYRIAKMHGLTVDALKRLNNLDGATIHPGQKLILEE